jgi:anthranilate/para-aminobenzoate synthase component I
VEGGERSGRFSFLGAGPRASMSWRLGQPGDPIGWIRRELSTHTAVRIPGTPRFSGGLVGFLAYDAVQLFEPRVPVAGPDELGFPAALVRSLLASEGARDAADGAATDELLLDGIDDESGEEEPGVLRDAED